MVNGGSYTTNNNSSGHAVNVSSLAKLMNRKKSYERLMRLD
jgi:hypothetical protein